MLLRALKAAKPGQDYTPIGSTVFADQDAIASWALEAIRYLNEAGIMNGTGSNQISPKGNTSREQAIALIKRTYEKFK